MHAFTLLACLALGRQINDMALREQQLWRQLATDFKGRPSEMCVRGGPEGPVRESNYPKGTVRPEKCQRSKEGQARSGPHSGTCRGGEAETWLLPWQRWTRGGDRCHQPREEGARQLNGCDK